MMRRQLASIGNAPDKEMLYDERLTVHETYVAETFETSSQYVRAVRRPLCAFVASFHQSRSKR